MSDRTGSQAADSGMPGLAAPPAPPLDGGSSFRDCLGDWLRTNTAVVGVGAVILGFLALCALRNASIKPFVTADEYQHVDYALALYRGIAPGYLPDETQPEMPGQGTYIQHVANHPPLYPYLVGWILRWGVASGHPWASVYVARGVTSLIAAAAIALIAATAYRLTGRRAGPTIGAALIAASCSPLISVATTVMNDALFISLSCATVYLTIRVLEEGPRRRLGILLVLATSAGLLTRSNGVAPLLASAGALFVMGLFPHALRGAKTAAQARLPVLLLAAAVVVVPVLTSGWFYLRNLQRWGSLFGDHIPGIRYGVPHDSAVGIFVRPSFWFYLVNQLYGRPPSGSPTAMDFGAGWPAQPTAIQAWAFGATLVAIAVAVVGLVGWLLASHRVTMASHRVTMASHRVTMASHRVMVEDSKLRGLLLVLAWSVPALVLIGTVAGTASHYAIGGSPHGRYALPGLTFYAAAMAMAAERWGRLRWVAMGSMLVAGVGGVWWFWASLLARPSVGLGEDPLLLDVPAAIVANGFPASLLMAAIAALVTVAGFGAGYVMYVRVGQTDWRRTEALRTVH